MYLFRIQSLPKLKKHSKKSGRACRTTQNQFWPCTNSDWPCSACNFLGAIQRWWKKYWATGLPSGLAATHSKLVPWEFQLEATIAIMSGRDSLIDVGTGYGKTLCVIIFCLLNPESLYVIFFPLERLQAVQVLEFECYGIKTLVINEDTPNDPDLWKVRPRKVLLGIFWSHWWITWDRKSVV